MNFELACFMFEQEGATFFLDLLDNKKHLMATGYSTDWDSQIKGIESSMVRFPILSIEN